MPETEAAPVTRTEQELARAQALVAELEARRLAEETAKASATPAVRALAVQLHSRLCPDDHVALECTWKTVPDHDSTELADWTEKDHAFWLEVARVGVGIQLELGWQVVEPA